MRKVAMLALGSLAVLPIAGARDDLHAAVRAEVKALEAAWNARDANAVAAIYAPDGDLIIVDGPRHSGRESIRKSAAAMWSGAPAERRISISVDGVRRVSPEVAIAECTARFSSGQPLQDRATWVFVWREGTWLVSAPRVMPAETSN